MDVDLGPQERAGDGLEGIFPVHLHGQGVTLGKAYGLGLEQAGGFLGVVRDEADDGRVAGVEDGYGHGVNVLRPKHLDEVVEPPDLVLGIDHELTDRFPARVAQGGNRWVAFSHFGWGGR